MVTCKLSPGSKDAGNVVKPPVRPSDQASVLYGVEHKTIRDCHTFNFHPTIGIKAVVGAETLLKCHLPLDAKLQSNSNSKSKNRRIFFLNVVQYAVNTTVLLTGRQTPKQLRRHHRSPKPRGWSNRKESLKQRWAKSRQKLRVNQRHHKRPSNLPGKRKPQARTSGLSKVYIYLFIYFSKCV